MKKAFLGKHIAKALSALGCLVVAMTIPSRAGGYAPETAPVITAFPESDGNAGIVALVVFGIIFAVGIVQILTKKWQDRGKGDKE